MKKIIFLILIFLSFVACSKSNTAKETAENYMRSMMKNPESFKVEYSEAALDTIPFFLDTKVLQAAKEAYESMEKYNRYKDRSYLWASEKSQASTELMANKLILDALCKEDDEDDSDPQLEYVVLMKSSATNPMGGRVSSKEIVIVDKEDPKKVLGVFQIDKEFIGEFMLAMYSRYPNWEIKQNQYGKYDTEGMSRIMKFIIED